MDQSALPENIDDIRCDTDFTIRADGTWLHEGTPIRRKALVKLFTTILCREEDGSYWLKTPVEQCHITVEDRPFLAIALQVSQIGQPTQSLRFHTTLNQIILLDEVHPLCFDEIGPYLPMERGLSARINRATWYELVSLAARYGREDNGQLEIQSAGQWFSLGTTA